LPLRAISVFPPIRPPGWSNAGWFETEGSGDATKNQICILNYSLEGISPVDCERDMSPAGLPVPTCIGVVA